jgi:hypothetical protein
MRHAFGFGVRANVEAFDAFDAFQHNARTIAIMLRELITGCRERSNRR